MWYRSVHGIHCFTRSRNTRSYYLVESYRDRAGKDTQRTLCYLGREQDVTDTLANALAHWETGKGCKPKWNFA